MPHDLKNCPCCDAVALYSWWGVNGMNTKPEERSHTVKCTNASCGMETPHSDKLYTQVEARSIWNRRPRQRAAPVRAAWESRRRLNTEKPLKRKRRRR